MFTIRGRGIPLTSLTKVTGLVSEAGFHGSESLDEFLNTIGYLCLASNLDVYPVFSHASSITCMTDVKVFVQYDLFNTINLLS